ncbi:MAG: beta-ketoacyl-ACP synthase II, partial [Dehalococcoidia bacterium]|nr:beta-ketoacyl-ACP synthase II [Dehalococcoidia bacterium]
LGESVDDFWNGLKSGASGVATMTLCDPSTYPCQVAGEVVGFDHSQYINKREARRMARFSQMAVVAGLQAMESSGLDLSDEDPFRLGIIMGNGNGGFPTLEDNCRVMADKGGMKMTPFFFPMVLPNMAAGNLSHYLGFKGYNATVSTACAASNQAIGEALGVIRNGIADVVFAGGSEAGISELGLSGFSVMRALTTQNENPASASRPFDLNRDGFIPAEGSGILVLENLDHAVRRQATILAEVVGFGCTADAGHLVQPEPTGSAASAAIQIALADAKLQPSQVDYINAHGTSTPLNDSIETTVIKRVFGEQAYGIPISSTKSMIGHSLGASGSLEAVACVKTIIDQVIHPTINYQTPDPECDLDYVPNEARRDLGVQVVLSNAFGFGGQNACLLFKKYSE